MKPTLIALAMLAALLYVFWLLSAPNVAQVAWLVLVISMPVGWTLSLLFILLAVRSHDNH